MSLHDVQITSMDLEENEIRLRYTPQSSASIIKSPEEIQSAARIRKYQIEFPVDPSQSNVSKSIVGTILINDISMISGDIGKMIQFSIDDGIGIHILECEKSIVVRLIKPNSVIQDPLKFLQGMKTVNVITSNGLLMK